MTPTSLARFTTLNASCSASAAVSIGVSGCVMKRLFTIVRISGVDSLECFGPASSHDSVLVSQVGLIVSPAASAAAFFLCAQLIPFDVDGVLPPACFGGGLVNCQ